MTTRIVKFERGDKTWFEVQVLVLGIFWISGDLYRQGFPNLFYTSESAFESLDKLKKTKTKKTIVTKVKI